MQSPIHRRRRVQWAAIGVSFTLLCAACSAPDANDDRTGETTVADLAQPVFKLDEMVPTLVDGTAESLTFQGDLALDQVAVGDVVVSADPAAPFLRRVTGRTVDSDGNVTLRTEDVGIDQLFSDADVSEYAQFLDFIPADGVEVVSQAMSAKTLDDVLGANVPVSSVDLTVKLTDHNGEGSANVKLDLAALLEMERSDAGGLRRLKSTIIANYEFGIGLSYKLGEFLNKKYPIGQYRMIFWIGFVPIYAEVDLVLEVTGDVKAAVSVAFKGRLESGGEWTSAAGWRQVHEHDPILGEGKVQGEIGLSAAAVVYLRFFRIAGPKVGFGPSFTASYGTADSCTIDYEIALKLEAALEFAKFFQDDSLDEKSFGFEFKDSVTKGNFKLCEQDKPAAPTNLQAARVDDEVKVALSWRDNANNEARYLVRWNDGGGWQDIAYVGADAVGYTHERPSTGLDNLYQVYAVGQEGTLSEPSNLASVTLEDMTPPPAPTNLAATAEGDQYITVTWSYQSDDEQGFVLERAVGDGGFEEYAGIERDTTAYVDRLVVPDQSYTYRVLAYSPAGASDYSNSATARTKLFDIAADKPSAPTGLTASAVAVDEIALTWEDNSAVEDNFVIERSTDGAGWSTITEPSVDATSYSDAGLSEDTLYYYRARASNALGDSAYSDIASARTLATDDSTDSDDNTSDELDTTPPGPEYVVWYTGNVSCWDAPLIYTSTRETFDAWRSTASVPGGGLDTTEELTKVELQGEFATLEDAQAWICPKFESRFPHYWCGSQYFWNGSYWMVNVACDLGGLPVDEANRTN